MRSFYKFLLAGLMCLPGVVSGQIPAVLEFANTRPGTYYYSVTYAQDGSISIRPISKVVAIGSESPPTPQPVPPYIPPYVPPAPQPLPPIPPAPVPVPPAPTPQPVPSDQIEVRIQQLTQQALDGGGSITTAVSLQRVYNIVGSTLDTNKLPKEKTFEALRVSTDIVMEQSKEGTKWVLWRSGVSTLLADLQMGRQLDSKEAIVNTIRRIENGMKNTLNTLGVGAQDNINWDSVLKTQQGILDAITKLK